MRARRELRWFPKPAAVPRSRALVAVAPSSLRYWFSGTSLLHRIPNAALGGVLLFGHALRIISLPPDRRCRPPIARRVSADFLVTAAGIIVLADRTRRRPRHRAVVTATWHMDHDARPRTAVLERVHGTSIWWPVSPNLPGEHGIGRDRRGISGAAVVPQCLPIFVADILSALKSSCRKRPACWCWKPPASSRSTLPQPRSSAEIIKQRHEDGIDFATIARLDPSRAQDAIVRFGIAALASAYGSPVPQRGRGDTRLAAGRAKYLRPSSTRTGTRFAHFDAFSTADKSTQSAQTRMLREPVPTTLENAIARAYAERSLRPIGHKAIAGEFQVRPCEWDSDNRHGQNPPR